MTWIPHSIGDGTRIDSLASTQHLFSTMLNENPEGLKRICSTGEVKLQTSEPFLLSYLRILQMLPSRNLKIIEYKQIEKGGGEIKT